MVDFLYSTHEKVYIGKVADNATQLISRERNILIGIIKDFEDSFDFTTGEWYT